MELTTTGILLASLPALIVLLVLAAMLVLLVRRPPAAAGDLQASLQQLAQAVQQGQAQVAVLGEKLARLEPVAQAVGDVRIELRALSERVLQVEQSQAQVHQGVAALGSGLAQTGTMARSLAETTAAIRDELSRAKQDLTELQALARARQELEQRTADSIRRLEAVIAGTQTKGAAGEQILEAVFAKLPAEWHVRDFRVGDGVVEFGLRLPSGVVLPIDSKWAATELLERLAACDDPAERQRLKTQIEAAVRARAKEVRKYLDPAVTTPFGVAAVPDAVYELCSGILADLVQANVALVSYSLFVPYLLLVFQTTLKHSHQIDLQKLDAYLQSVQGSLAALQEELDGRFARAITMLQNSRAEMGAQLGKVAGGLAGLRVGGEVGVTKIDSAAAADQAAPDRAGDGRGAASGAVSSIVVTSDAPSAD